MHISLVLTLIGSCTNFLHQYLPMILHSARVQKAFQLDKQLLGALLRSHACEGGFREWAALTKPRLCAEVAQHSSVTERILSTMTVQNAQVSNCSDYAQFNTSAEVFVHLGSRPVHVGRLRNHRFMLRNHIILSKFKVK